MKPFQRLSLKPKLVRHDLNAPILALDQVSVRFDSLPALTDVSFSLQTGERVAVVGPNGAGKSTLFNVISGMITPDQGQVRIYGQQPSGHICIAYVPQRNQVDWRFPVTVEDVVMMGRAGKIGMLRRPGSHDRHIVDECLHLVEMDHLAERQIGELSGGQQQRVFIARALAQEAELMLMDEPLSGLDVKSQEDIFTILDMLKARDVTIMVATHDLNAAAGRFDRLMLIRQTIMAFGQADDVCTPANLKQAFGGQLQLLSTAEGTMVLAQPNREDS